MSKMKKMLIALSIILSIIFLVWGITKVFAQDDHYGHIYRCNTCKTNEVEDPYFWIQEKTTQCTNCKSTDIELRIRYRCNTCKTNFWSSEDATQCTGCKSTDIKIWLTKAALKGADWKSKVTGLTNKFRKTFYTTYKCEIGHIYTSTGSYYDRYGWKLTTRQTDIETCPYAACGAAGTKYERQNIIYIRGLEMAASFDNIYCVAHGQDMDTLIQRNGALYDATVKVEINGNIANFYEYKLDDGTYKYVKIGTVEHEMNNTIAAILAAQNIEKGYTDNYDRNEQYHNGANGATYEEAQILLYKYWNDWVNDTGATNFGLAADDGNQDEKIQKLYGDSALNTKLENAIGSDQKYSATIYFLKYNCNNNFSENLTITYDGKYCYTLITNSSGNAKTGTNNFDEGDDNLQELILVDVPVYVTKVWDDDNNSAGARPESVTIELYANGVATGKTLVLNEENNWSGKFENLDTKDSDGNLITYTVREKELPDGYTSEITGDQYEGYTITNTLSAKTKVEVIKKWEDDNNAEGFRPESIEVTLVASGIPQEEQKIILNEANSWKGTFENLEKYSPNGDLIVYSVKETAILNYKEPTYNTTINQNGDVFTCTITNILNKTDINVIKVWDDNNNEEKLRPESITVTLYANGEAVEGKTLTLNEDNDWTGKFDNLDKYSSDGKEIVYTVQEAPVEHYKEPIYTETKDGDVITLTITNKRIASETEVTVIKNWDDEENSEGFRPESITVTLFANGVSTATIATLNDENNWTATFKNLAEYKDGEKISYTVEESEVADYEEPVYTKTEEGKEVIYTITNKRVPTKTEVKVTKQWNDKNNLQEIRPSSITVELYADGVSTGITKTLSESNNWTETFEDLNEYANGTKIVYTVEEVDVPEGYTPIITGNQDDGYTITNTAKINYHGYIEISGKVWLDRRDGKGNDINGVLDDDESGLKGIKVILRDRTGKQFDATSTAITDGNGNYIIRVNYDNSEAVYKLYEDAATVQEKLKTAYVEFQYNGMKYTTVANAATGANTSKAMENETLRNSFDKALATVTPSTNSIVWERRPMTANTQNVISFANYSNKTTINRKEILKVCTGNGTYILSNPKYPWDDVLTGNCDSINHPATCTGKQHIIGTDTVKVTKILNVNLGLFEREQPDVAIFSDLSKVQVITKDQEYTYLYGARGGELEAEGGLKVKFQNKETYTYRRPVNPADIAYLNSEEATGNEMVVKVTYQIRIGNLSTTLPITVHNITNYFDSRYTLTTSGWTQSSGSEFSTSTYNGDLNITVQPGKQSDVIELTYTVSQDAIKALLSEDATLNHAVEIQSYSTGYGEKTLYAEQRTGGRTGKPYGGYDSNSHPGNAGIFINGEERLEATILEDDTDIAPSFVLCKDVRYYKWLSGNVWEDTDPNSADEYRLGDGKKSDTEKNVANVKVELFKVKDDGTLEIAKLYSNGSEVKTKDAITYTNADGYYVFGDEEYSVRTDTYVIKFTYGEGIDGSTSTTIDGSNISARNYKSTIISSENAAIYNLFKGTNNNEWHLNTTKGYSTAVDTVEERQQISDLQYSNYEDEIYITAWTKPFTMQLEFDPTVGKTSSVEEDGFTVWTNELDVFDFGIIEMAKEDIYVETTMDYLKITLANGQVLTEGNPQTDEMNYAKPVGFNQNITNGSQARSALEKQIVVEMDTELMQGAKLEVKYEIKVTNNSEKDIDYFVNGEYKTEFYYFGEIPEGSSVIRDSVNKVVAYLDSELVYSEDDLVGWDQVTAQQLKDDRLISEATYNALKNNDYIIYVTDKASELAPGGEPMTTTVTASKVLANQDENVYDIQAEILEVDAKTARTTSSKQYKMGNYVPSLTTRKVNNNINNETAGLHEQDDDRVKIIVTPPTGLGTYIIKYLAVGLAGLIVIAIVVIFIKKKVLTK